MTFDLQAFLKYSNLTSKEASIMKRDNLDKLRRLIHRFVLIQRIRNGGRCLGGRL